MSNDPSSDLGQLVVAFLLVAAVAVPVAIVAVAWLRWNQVAILPTWASPPALPRFGLSVEVFDFAFIFFFLLAYAGLYPALVTASQQAFEALGFFDLLYGPSEAHPDEEATENLRMMWGIAFAAPFILALWLGFQAVSGNGRLALSLSRFVQSVALGVGAWLLVTPVVFAVHITAILVSAGLGVTPDQHPIARHGVGLTVLDRFLFGMTVCLFTPLIEEILFRGLLAGWVGGRRYRPWILMILAGGIAVLTIDRSSAPAIFVLVLAVGLVAVQFARRFWRRFPVRTASSMYSTAALFAVAHSSIWPTPVPLFVLGLALGYLAVRTWGVTSCIVLHGLFNAVSFTLLLRGGTG